MATKGNRTGYLCGTCEDYGWVTNPKGRAWPEVECPECHGSPASLPVGYFDHNSCQAWHVDHVPDSYPDGSLAGIKGLDPIEPILVDGRLLGYRPSCGDEPDEPYVCADCGEALWAISDLDITPHPAPATLSLDSDYREPEVYDLSDPVGPTDF